MATTERVVLLMSPEEKARLTSLARQSDMSVGEFIRRLIRERASDSKLAAEMEGRRPEFEALLSELENSARRAHAALFPERTSRACRFLTGSSSESSG